MEDSESGGEDGMVGGWRWNNRNTGARDQTQLRQKIRDLPGLLKHGLHLRKKSVSIDRKMSLPCVCFGYSLPSSYLLSLSRFTQMCCCSTHDLTVPPCVYARALQAPAIHWLRPECVFRCRTYAVAKATRLGPVLNQFHQRCYLPIHVAYCNAPLDSRERICYLTMTVVLKVFLNSPQVGVCQCIVYMLKREGMVALLRPVLEEGRTHT